jgi:hypothetical protein
MYAIMIGCWILRLDIPLHVMEYVRIHEPDFDCTIGEKLSFQMIINSPDANNENLRQLIFRTL